VERRLSRFSDKLFPVVGLALLSAVLTVAVAWVDRLVELPGAVHIALTVLPLVPLAAMFFGIARWIEALDELQRLIHLEAFVFQFSATGLLVMGYGSLARAGVLPDLPVSGVFPGLWLAVFVFWALGLALVRRKYR